LLTIENNTQGSLRVLISGLQLRSLDVRIDELSFVRTRQTPSSLTEAVIYGRP